MSLLPQGTSHFQKSLTLTTFVSQPGPKAKNIIERTLPVHIPIEEPATISNKDQDDKMEFGTVQEIDPHSGTMVDIIVLDVSAFTMA